MENETLIKTASGRDYYEIDRMSNSALSHFKRSPRHYLYYKDKKVEPTPAMIFGRAFHCWVLENEKFYEQFFILDTSKRPEPDKTMASNQNKLWKQIELSNHRDKTELSADDLQQIKAMHESLLNHDPAARLIEQLTEVEKELFWEDDITGVKMKGKLDGFHPDFTIDLKTCLNAEPETFSSTAFNNYITQPAVYVDGRGLCGLKKGKFYFICIEKDEPFGISVLKCGDDFIKQGRYAYGQILEDYNYWLEQGAPDVGYEWRSPITGEHNLNLPYWMK